MPARCISPSACCRDVTFELRPSTPNHRRVSCAALARLHSVSLGRRSTQACCACAPCRAGCGRTTPHRRAPHRREASLLRDTTVVQRASCRLQYQASAACLACVCRATARSLSRGRRLSILFYRARALSHCVRLAYTLLKALRRREASLLWLFSKVRRASCGLQP